MTNKILRVLDLSSLRTALLWIPVAVLVAGCSKPEPAPEPIRAVKVVTVQAEPLHSRLEFAGDVRARVTSALGFRVAGKLIKRQAEVGQRVKVGQVLAELDPSDYRLAAAAAQAQVAAALTNRDLASADFKRYKELREQNFISGAELERRESTLKAAQAQLEQAQAQLASQGNQAGYTRLMADVSGVVTAVQAEVGQVVGAGTPVVIIAQDGPRDVVFTVPEDRVAAVKVGEPVGIKVWANDDLLDGKVREVAASADPVTRTFQVKVELAAKDELPLGATVTVLPPSMSREGLTAIKLPTSALRRDGGGSAVWVLDTGSMTLRSQAVQVETADGNDVVIASGLTPGMVVVVAGVHVLAPGQKVQIYQGKTTPGQAAKAATAANTVATPAPAPVAPAAPAASAGK
ncbi:efflux RND transporter periplasmic adaptor subunit [Variovorax sp. HJSM1_2]|uniref:efflux RND transporter periplasmic adaptor subunit n=1 Tax=Variovorax sp. HJSM1_2 TaxID=3366263 RepID=UPI003BD2B480